MDRDLFGGMGKAIAERTILRKGETWKDVAKRVAEGNAALLKNPEERKKEQEALEKHLRNATLLMSGRHLQNGDKSQEAKTQTRFTNCSTAALSFVKFYLLLCGSGVGRCYDDDLMSVDWDNQPNTICVLDENHRDYNYKIHISRREALHQFGGDSKSVLWHVVGDSREGWAKAVEMMELAAFEKVHKDKTLILDFSEVRPEGSPIEGIQGKPSSGPLPVMGAIAKVASLKGSGLPRWKQAMFVDHFLSESVMVGGVRRSARIAVKHWKDEGIFDFIQIKRPIEYIGKTLEEIKEIQRGSKPNAFLWSANNSIAVDKEFYALLNLRRGDERFNDRWAIYARKVFRMATECAYIDRTGEPGFANVHRLAANNEGIEDIFKGDFLSSDEYEVEDGTELLLKKLGKKAKAKSYHYIMNPCGEIVLSMLCGFCVIADCAPFHADTLEEAEDAYRVAARALLRVNTMPSIYSKEVKRTNRIGVGSTGIHEFAWKFFQVGFRDLINPDFEAIDDANPKKRAADFWRQMRKFNRIVNEEAVSYSKELGTKVPHTSMTIKPAGTTSKLFGLTEGCHLPAMQFYLRNVQFSTKDPLVQKYKDKGYPVKELKTYQGSSIVGFPTKLAIVDLGMGDNLIVASEAPPDEQFAWLRLLERHYINGDYPERGNQVSYTLKYDPEKVNLKEFREVMKENLPTVKCVTVSPEEDESAFEYLPDEMISKKRYDALMAKVESTEEEVDREHVECAGGACPIDFNDRDK